MDMSGMGGMGGIDMGSNGLFKATDMSIARSFWYAVAALVALRSFERGYSYIRTKTAKSKPVPRSDVPSRPVNVLSRTHETLVTICREMTYPQLSQFKGRISRHFTFPPLGNCLMLAAYWLMILTMLWANTILTPSSSMYAYKWEKVGFRAAWVSVTQLPLIYCLSGKFNIISVLTGVSYERLNWLHHWVARTMFLTVIVHWSFFFTEWSIANFIKFELQMMPMVKYGFGAWAVLGWTVITSFGFFRNLGYELWVLQHLTSAGVLLWLLYVHVPSYARYNIYLSISFIAFDRGVRGIWSVAHNLHLRDLWTGNGRSGPWLGFDADAATLSHRYIHLRIHNINFDWKPGQHIFINVPTCGIVESHPFTIATEAPSDTSLRPDQPRSVDIYFKCHSGFTRKLFRKAVSHPDGILKPRIFLSRPFGISPLSGIERSNSLVLIASSTGASFTMPLLEHALKYGPFIQRVCFIWIVRHRQQLSWFRARIAATANAAEKLGVDFRAQFFITGRAEEMEQVSSSSRDNRNSGPEKFQDRGDSVPLTDLVDSERGSLGDGLLPPASASGNAIPGGQGKMEKAKMSEGSSSDRVEIERLKAVLPQMEYKGERTVTTSGRPSSWDALIYPTIVNAEGETAIVACGGNSLMSEIRNYVAQLSDERAVHKGTGAQGIYLFTETYGW